MNDENLTLLDVIDRATLQSLQDAFSDATGMAALTTDQNGAVTELSNPTDFCMYYTRKSPVGCERCNQCDLQGGSEASRTGRPSVYYCHGGLVDFAAPIIVNGKHIGSLIGGQVLTEKPDEEKFRKIAVEIGVNPDEYIAALRKVKIVPKAQIDAAANLLFQMANALSKAGYQRTQAEGNNVKNAEAIEKVNETQAAIDAKITEVIANIEALKKDFAKIKVSSEKSEKSVSHTDSIIKAIESASTQLTLISFNASIEAKRAGAAGAGFNVIAQEVRNLANTNTHQAVEVESTLNEIKKVILEINNQLDTVDSEINKNVEIITNLRDLIARTSELVHNMNN